MRRILFAPIFSLFMIMQGCTIERAVEHVVAEHANGAKKTSFWIYPDGTILKRNEWYTDGIKEYEIPYKDSVPHGEFKRWDGYGDLSTVGEYKQGKRSGTWTSYYAGTVNSRKKQAVRYYKDDHPVGDWKGWYLDDKPSFEEHYNENGDSVGVWKKWDDKGTLVEENSCFKANEKGYFKKFAKSCRILEYYECSDGEREGEYKFYYETFEAPDSTGESCNTSKIRESGLIDYGSLIPYTFYRADGSVIKTIKYGGEHSQRSHDQWFDEHGVLLRESIYKHSDFDGNEGVAYGLCEGSTNLFCAETSFVRYYCPSGSMDSSTLSQKDAFSQSIGKYKASVRYIKPDRKLLYEEYWDMDTLSGIGNPLLLATRGFYPDSMGGKMASEGFWGNPSTDGKSKRHGIWRNWYPSGILKDSLTYVNGERVGDQFSYDSTGKLTIHKTENGKNRPVIMHILGQQ